MVIGSLINRLSGTRSIAKCRSQQPANSAYSCRINGSKSLFFCQRLSVDAWPMSKRNRAQLDLQNPKPRLPSQPNAPNLKFERADWTSFRTVEGLQQKAGVPAGKLRRLVLKELTDNALDTGASVRIGELPKGG